MRRLFKSLISDTPPDTPQRQASWIALQLATLLLPFSSLLGSLGFILVTLGIWRRQFSTLIRRPLNWGLAIVGLLMVVSAAMSLKPIDAALGLFNFLPLFLIFAALSELIQTPTHLRRLSWILVIASVPVVLIGIGQQFLGWAGQVQLWWLVNWTIYPTGNPPGRMASVYAYANVLASYLVITFIVSLALWIEAFRWPDRTQHSQTHSLTRRRLWLSLIVLGNGIALIFTNSRNVWAIAILASLAFALYLGWRWLLVVVGLVATSIVGAAFGPGPIRQGLRTVIPAFFWARLTDELYPDRPVAQLRTTQWRFAWSLTQQRPWTGWGLRNFTPLYESQMRLFIGHPHNLFLMLGAETGLPAALLLFSLVGWIVFQGARLLLRWERRRSLMTAEGAVSSPDQWIVFTYLTAFMGCTLFSLLDITLFDVRINLLGWLLLAGICGQVYGHQQNDRRLG